MKAWVLRNRRIIALKVCVAVALAAAHYFPQSGFGLLVNLAWLFLF